MIWTIHVDDIIVLARALWLHWSLTKMEKRFGKIKRNGLPFTHMGMSYELLRPRHLFIHQRQFTLGLVKVDIDKKRRSQLEADCDQHETHGLRSLLCSLLWLCQTREDIYCEVVQMQQTVRQAKVKHLKQANGIVDRAQRNMHLAGLHFPPLNRPV